MRLIARLLLAIVCIVLSTIPVVASTSRSPMDVGDTVDAIFVKPGTDTVVGVSILRTSSPRTAYAATKMTPADVERAANVIVLDYADTKPVAGSSSTRIFKIISNDGTMGGTLILASSGAYLYMLITTGSDIEGQVMQDFLESCIATQSIAPAPKGFIRKD